MLRKNEYQEVNRMYGIYNTNKKIIQIESKKYFYYENDKYVICYDGHIKTKNPFEEKVGCFDWREIFIDTFLLIRFDKITGNLFISQHLFGNGKNIYFIKKSDELIFASSLNELKRIADIPFELNVAMLPYYFYNGFLPGSHTLIKGVQKLEAGVCLRIDGSFIQKENIPLNSKSVEAESESLAERYKSVLSESIFSEVNDIEEPVSIALSGGYDSNCILFSIKKLWPSRKINAFSIGGINGIDETKVASQIAEMYQSVQLFSALVTPDTLKHLDEIVCILEGTVYERGIFLQYELAKLMKSHSIHNLICGECADQVFHQNTYNRIPENTFLYGYLDTPCQMATYVVLKKSRLIMEAFGIDTRYPFLTPGMIDIGYETRFINGSSKEFHKTQCKEILPQKVLELISKQGGSTDLSSLFYGNISNLLEKRKYYSSSFRITGKYCKEEAIRDYYLSLLYLESFEKQFCDIPT